MSCIRNKTLNYKLLFSDYLLDAYKIYQKEKRVIKEGNWDILADFLLYIVTYLTINNNSSIDKIYYAIEGGPSFLIEWTNLNELIVDRQISPLIMDVISELGETHNVKKIIL